MEVKIRNAELSDIDEIYRLEQECFTSEAWSRSGFEYVIKNEDGLFTTLVAELDGEVGGYMCGSADSLEGEIQSIAVDKRFRRQGVGRALLEEFERIANTERIFLEVRASNFAAIALYEGLGFEKISVRREYYQTPTEDAVLMCNTNSHLK